MEYMQFGGASGMEEMGRALALMHSSPPCPDLMQDAMQGVWCGVVVLPCVILNRNNVISAATPRLSTSWLLVCSTSTCSEGKFGFPVDNSIGATPQANG